MVAAVRPLPAGSVVPPCVALTMRGLTLASPPTLDRRGGPRGLAGLDRSSSDPSRGAVADSVDRFTAASHHPLPLTFAIGVDGHWALMVGVSISPHGVLLRAALPHEAALELPQRDVMRAWRKLGARVPAASPLWFSTACVGARALVAALSERAASSVIAVDLVPLDDRSALCNRVMRGHLAPLADPAPHVLGVVLDDPDRRSLERVVETPARSPRGPRAAEDVVEITWAAPSMPEPPSAPSVDAPEARTRRGRRGRQPKGDPTTHSSGR